MPRKLLNDFGQLGLILAAYLPFLGRMSVPLTGDQKVYLSTAMEMQQTGNWLHPILFGQHSYYKPPLQYWATILGWKVFGFNFLGALLPSVFALLLTAFILVRVARFFHSESVLSEAGLWFAASLGAVTYGTTAQMEIYVCLFYAASWWAGLKFLKDSPEKRKTSWLFLAFSLAGISALVKSPLYSVFWVLSFLSYLILSGEWRVFRERRLYLAWALGILFGAAWYVALFISDGSRFWSDYVMRETWEKNSGNGGTAISLWLALLYWCFPFTLFALASLRSIWSQKKTGKLANFVLCWCWPPAIFFSLYPYKIKPYLFILVPALALLVDWGWIREGRTLLFRWTARVTGVIFALTMLVLAVVVVRGDLAAPWVVIGLVAVACFSLVVAWFGKGSGLAIAGLMGVLFFRIGAVALGESDLADLRALASRHPELELAMLDERNNIWHEVGLLSVAMERPVRRLSNLDEVVTELELGGYVALDEEQYKGYRETIQAKLLGRGDMANLEAHPWSRWKVRAHFPFKEVILRGRLNVPDFEEKTRRTFQVLSLGVSTSS